MAVKEVRFSADARARVLRGVDLLAHAVTVTLGPKGHNVVMEKPFGPPRISKDGVSVAREIELSDRFENMGAQMMREVATKTSELAGDGTTTAVVLTQALAHEGIKAVAGGLDPMELKRGIDLAVTAAVEDIARRSRQVTTTDEIAQVATISANGEHEIGDMVARAMDKSRRKPCGPSAMPARADQRVHEACGGDVSGRTPRWLGPPAKCATRTSAACRWSTESGCSASSPIAISCCEAWPRRWTRTVRGCARRCRRPRSPARPSRPWRRPRRFPARTLRRKTRTE